MTDGHTEVSVDPDGVPDALRQRGTWLCWEEEQRNGEPTKLPVDPDTGDRASVTDPATWDTFTTAVDHYRNHDGMAGIGYVFASGGPIVGVDLDHCRDPDSGELEPWAAEIVDQLDSYAEVSPSGTGVHVIVRGELPDGGNRSGDVEMYDARRFFTVTGRPLDGYNQAVADRQTALEAVHDEHVADTDDSPENGSSGPENVASEPVDLDDKELIEKAKAANNGEKFIRLWNGDTAGYPSQSEADLALCGLLAFWTGGDRQRMDRLFRRSGLMRDKWDEDRGSRTYGEHTIAKAIEGRTEWYDPNADTQVSDPERGESGTNESVETDDVASPRPHLQEHNGTWGYWKGDGDDHRWNAVLNCQLKVDARTVTPRGDHELTLTVYPTAGEPYQVTVAPDAFHDPRRFRDNVLTGPTVTFDGSQRELNSIKKAVGTQNAPKLDGTHHIGLHGDEWVTPDGVLTADGWTDDPETTHLARNVGLERKWSLSPTDGDTFDADAVRTIIELLPQTRPQERLLSVLGWFCAATLRPKIVEHTGQFNFLTVLGETGAGKTSTLSVLWEAFGMDGEPHSASDTTFTLTATMAATNAVPVWYDEYKPSDMTDREVDRFLALLRKTTRGAVEQRGRRDQSTEEYRLKAPVVVSGEERIHGGAEERRGIFTTFTTAATDPGTEYADAFAQLTGGSATADDGTTAYYEGHPLDDHALAWYRFILSLDDKELTELWRKQRERVSRFLADHGHPQPGDLVLQGLQTVAFGCELYRQFGQNYGTEPFDSTAITDALGHLVDHGLGGMGRKSHWDTFLGVATRAAATGELVDSEHYTVVNDGGPDAELRIHLSTAVDVVRRYAREHDTAEDLLGSADDYRERATDMVEDPETYITAVGKVTRGVDSRSRCIGVDLHRADDVIDTFEPESWGADASRRDPRERLLGIIRKQTGGDQGPTVPVTSVKGTATGSIGMDMDTVETALQQLKEHGEIQEPTDGQLEPT